MKRYLIINIGGSSSKVGIAEGAELTAEASISYEAAELKKHGNLWEQLGLRTKGIEGFLAEQGLEARDLSGIITRGPLVKPIEKGAYLVNEAMIVDAKSGRYGLHPCSLGAEIAYRMAGGSIPIYTVDPPCSDELIEQARLTGLPFIERKSYYQVLNHHAVAKSYAASMGRTYEDMALVIAHLGSGVSVASHLRGRVMDVTNGLEGDGPMGLDRTGTIPARALAEVCFSGEYTEENIFALLAGQGGMKAHLGTIDAKRVEAMIEAGDEKAKAVYEAMAFQVSKGIGAASAAMGMRPDAVLLTGGLSNSDLFTGMIRERCEWIAPVVPMREECEMKALLLGVLEGIERGDIRVYE